MSRAGRHDAGASDTIVLALDMADSALAERLIGLLGDVPGLRLAGPGEAADAALVAIGETEVASDPVPAVRPDPQAPLTPREREVLALLAQGASNKLLARRLGISVHTAKFHVGRLIDKLEATGRTDAVAHAARLGVIQL